MFDQFKTLRSFILLSMLTTSPLFSDIRRLTAVELRNFTEKMVSFHNPTSSGDHSPKPDVSRFKEELLIAKMDSFGLDRFFVFQNNNDVNELVRAVQQGGGMNVSWYYVKPEDTICIMTLDEWQNQGQSK